MMGKCRRDFIVLGIAATLVGAPFPGHSSELRYPQYGAEKLDRNDRGPYLNKIRHAEEDALAHAYTSRLSQTPPAAAGIVREVTVEQLKASQKAWETYRDENCLYYGGLHGGNEIDIGAWAAECQIYETKQRILFLNDPR